MIIEPRGKFGGVKIHLDKEECERLLGKIAKLDPQSLGKGAPIKILVKMGKGIKKLQEQHPDLLQDKSLDQVMATLAEEAEKAQKKLEKLKEDPTWPQQKVSK